MKRIAMLSAAGLLAVSVVLAGGLALAGSGGTSSLQACYHNGSGAVRVDVAGTGCRPNETPVALGAGLTTRRVVATGMLPSPGFVGAAAECAEGEVVLGGGLEVESINPEIGIVTNAPVTLADGRQAWQVTMHSAALTGDPVAFRAYAVCAPGTGY